MIKILNHVLLGATLSFSTTLVALAATCPQTAKSPHDGSTGKLYVELFTSQQSSAPIKCGYTDNDNSWDTPPLPGNEIKKMP